MWRRNNIETKNQCVICEEQLVNQVCPQCLASEVESWLVDYRQDLIEKFNSMNFAFNSHMCTGSYCTICNQEMAVCQSCYLKEVSTFLEEERSLLEGTFAEDFVLSRV